MIPEKTKETSRKKDRKREGERERETNVCNVNYFVSQSLINRSSKSDETISKTKIKKKVRI